MPILILGDTMKYTHIILIAVILLAFVASAEAGSSERCKIIPADHQEVRVHESHDLRVYHIALNHTKSDKVIKVKSTEE
jgi:hypothetical protein